MSSVELNTKYGPVTLKEQWSATLIAVGESEVRITPVDVDAIRFGNTFTEVVTYHQYNRKAAGARDMATAMQYAADLADLIDAANADAIAAAQERQRREREERERKAREREEEIQRRTDILLNELIGERVNLRQDGYKTMRQAEVDVYEYPIWDSEADENRMGYKPRLNYVLAADAARTQSVADLKRCDVKVPGTRRWKTVWDDGLDDLSEWERDSPSLRPVEEHYDGTLRDD